jgi:hypothetical protein
MSKHNLPAVRRLLGAGWYVIKGLWYFETLGPFAVFDAVMTHAKMTRPMHRGES